VSIFYRDDTITLHHGDSLEVARTLETGSVDCIVTSPPYYGLRDYGNDGQYGLEDTPADYVETLRALFSELRRLLSSDGTLWLNIGDSYGRNKRLLGVPWRVALELQDDGWILRNSIIWHKPNAMPESVTDRLSVRHENLFMFSKASRYWFDLDPIREESGRVQEYRPNKWAGDGVRQHHGHRGSHANGRNPGDVWDISTEKFAGHHFAVMPQELARRAIVVGCKPGGVVLDPFSGSGTTGLVAQNNGRRYVGIDISADYLKLSLETRLQNAALDLGGVA